MSIVALLVLGPQRLVKFARTAGKTMRRMRDMSGELTRSITDAVGEEEAKERKRKKVLGEAAAIKEVPTDPVERLQAILQVNRVDPEVTETVVNIFRLTPRLWGDPYELDDLLRPRVKPQSIVPSLVRHYMDGVEIPRETAQRYSIPLTQLFPIIQGGEGGRGYGGYGEYPGHPGAGL